MNVPEQWLPSASDQEDEQRDRVRAVEAEWDQRQRRFGAREEREAVQRRIDAMLDVTGEWSDRFDVLGWRGALAELHRVIAAGEHRKP